MPLIQRVCSEKIGVGPVAVVNSGKVSLQKDRKVSQRATFFHFPTPASLFLFFSLILAENMGTSTYAEMVHQG